MPSFQKKRKIAAGVVIVAGIVGAFLVVSPGKENGAFAFDINLADGISRSLSFQKNTSFSDSPSGSFDPKNLTDVFINRFGAEILKKNPQGPLDQRITIPSQESIENLIKEEMGKGGAPEKITARDIRSAPEDTPEAALSYLEQVVAANSRFSKKTNNNIGEVIYFWLEKNDPDLITKHIDALSSLTSELLAIPVPASWDETHISLVNLQQKKIYILKSILGIADDPVKALAAVNEVDLIPDEEARVAEMIRSNMRKAQ